MYLYVILKKFSGNGLNLQNPPQSTYLFIFFYTRIKILLIFPNKNSCLISKFELNASINILNSVVFRMFLI